MGVSIGDEIYGICTRSVYNMSGGQTRTLEYVLKLSVSSEPTYKQMTIPTMEDIAEYIKQHLSELLNQ